MKPEAQQQALEEICGTAGQWIEVGGPPGARAQLWKPAPDYLNDLNAMHEVWKTLTIKEHQMFRAALGSIVYEDGFIPDNPHRSLSNATASQRAKAFLIVKQKWTS